MSEDLKVCPCCGGDRHSTEAEFCQYCGDKLVKQSELPRDIWKDPNVKAALKEGRSADDIYVISCPKCNLFSYYNEGSSFTCRFGCGAWRVDEASDAVTLSDTVTETTEGYHNQTL